MMLRKRVRARIGRGGREVWAAKCEQCGKTLPQSKMQVDHINPAGSLKDDVGGFIDRLFCEEENMRIVCKTCHSLISLAERKGISIDEAKLEQLAIKFALLPTERQKQLLEEWGIELEKNNAKTRREAAKRYYEQD